MKRYRVQFLNIRKYNSIGNGEPGPVMYIDAESQLGARMEYIDRLHREFELCVTGNHSAIVQEVSNE